jgi:hypothetical protein
VWCVWGAVSGVCELMYDAIEDEHNQHTTDNCDLSGWCVSVCGQDGRKMDQKWRDARRINGTGSRWASWRQDRCRGLNGRAGTLGRPGAMVGAAKHMLAHNKVQLAAMIHGRKIDALFMDAKMDTMDARWQMAGRRWRDADGTHGYVVCSVLMVSLCVLCVYF